MRREQSELEERSNRELKFHQGPRGSWGDGQELSKEEKGLVAPQINYERQ